MLNKFDFICWEIEQKMRKFDYAPSIEHNWAIYPLRWYVSTGRAPTDFIIRFNQITERQKTTIAKRLLKAYRESGTHDAGINTVCQYIGFERNAA